jgi:hypothetical protein
MWERLERMPIVHALAFLLGAAVFLWGTISSIRSGIIRAPTYGARIIADRSNDPVMFWIYVVIGLGVTGVCFVFGLDELHVIHVPAWFASPP